MKPPHRHFHYKRWYSALLMKYLVTVRCWVDAHHPAVHIEIDSDTPVTPVLTSELWRPAEKHFTFEDEGGAYGQGSSEGNINPIPPTGSGCPPRTRRCWAGGTTIHIPSTRRTCAAMSRGDFPVKFNGGLFNVGMPGGMVEGAWQDGQMVRWEETTTISDRLDPELDVE
jgi:hypothetical protein